MASITSLGAGSGIFSSDLVSQLVEAERAPAKTRLDSRQATTESKISAFGALRSALEAMKTPMDALASDDGLRAFSSSSSSEGVVGVSIDAASAQRGSYQVNVTQLAQSQSLASGEYADRDTTGFGSGTLSLSVGGETTEITIDSSNNTLDGIAKAINDSGAAVSAGVVDTGTGYRLVLSSQESGTDNTIELSVSGDADGNDSDSSGLSSFTFNGTTQNLTETVEAKNAQLEVNGIAITRSSNTVEDVIDGVTFDLKSAGTSTVAVTEDSQAVADRVQAFVDKYNAFQDAVRKTSGYNATSGQGGILNGDATVRGIQSDLRGLLTSIPDGMDGSPVRMLADIGLSTDPSTGKLEFDEDKFKEQLADYPDSVSQLFQGSDGSVGIASQLSDRLENILSSNGALSARTDGLNDTLSDIAEQREDLARRIESYEQRLISQFSAADSLISQIQSTGNYVTQQLASLSPQNNQQ